MGGRFIYTSGASSNGYITVLYHTLEKPNRPTDGLLTNKPTTRPTPTALTPGQGANLWAYSGAILCLAELAICRLYGTHLTHPSIYPNCRLYYHHTHPSIMSVVVTSDLSKVSAVLSSYASIHIRDVPAIIPPFLTMS